jgi:hypothetical protein
MHCIPLYVIYSKKMVKIYYFTLTLKLSTLIYFPDFRLCKFVANALQLHEYFGVWLLP